MRSAHDTAQAEVWGMGTGLGKADRRSWRGGNEGHWSEETGSTRLGCRSP